MRLDEGLRPAGRPHPQQPQPFLHLQSWRLTKQSWSETREEFFHHPAWQTYAAEVLNIAWPEACRGNQVQERPSAMEPRVMFTGPAGMLPPLLSWKVQLDRHTFRGCHAGTRVCSMSLTRAYSTAGCPWCTHALTY